MSTAALEMPRREDAITSFQKACLHRINAHPGDTRLQDRVLDLYLETVRRLEMGWTVQSVLTNSLIRLSHL